MDMSPADIRAVTNGDNDNGMMGGDGSWMMMFLFFILAMGGMGGMGGFGARGAIANEISNDFLYTNLNNTVDRGFNQLANQNFGISRDLCQGFAGVDRGLCSLQHNQDKCCCEIKQQICDQTYTLSNAIHCEGEATRALINANTMQELRDNLQDAKNSIINTAQTQTLIGAIRPFPVPSYPTCSPYTAFNGYGCGNFNSGCGCN